ncbi:MAG: DUF4070 domain-containing protein [Bacteroidetes bacterium]|nr:MAG: DUF4070 domain-containing protein [Bacteroidota bacterium]
MNILLVYPEMPDTLYGMRHLLKAVGKRGAYPPLGLLTIAPMLPSHWNKRLLDTNLKPLTQADLAWADMVFLSAMNVQELAVRDILKQCQAAGVTIVAGGSLFTHEHERFPGIDYFVLNEAEITLPQFISDFEAGNPQRIYQSEAFADISLSPVPAFELAKMDEYLYAIVQYSRGCPYLCDFCDVTALYGRVPRVKSSDQIIAELEKLMQYQSVRLVLFADDNLIGNKKILKKDLLPRLIQWRKEKNPSFFFATQLTINLADDEELMQMLIDAGFRHVFVGIETPDEQGLAASRKTQNLRRNQLDTIQKLHNTGFIIAGGFIVGFDTDSPGIFEQQVNFIQESGIPLPIVNILKAPPGTELFEKIKSQGRLSREFAFSEGETNIIPVMDEKMLFEGFLSLAYGIYHPSNSLKRFQQFFNTYGSPKTQVKVPEKVSFKEILLTIQAVYRIGIADSQRKYFWKLIWWTYKHHRKHLDKAFSFGLMMHQMYRTYLHIREQVNAQNPGLVERPLRQMAEAEALSA